LYVNILRPEQDTAWPAAEHVAYILLDPEFFFRNKEKLVNIWEENKYQQNHVQFF
jgi:hypothetical protein